MTARARVWVGDWAQADVNQWIQTDHCHLSRRGRVPDEKTPGHEAKYKSSVPYLHPQIRVWKPTNERFYSRVDSRPIYSYSSMLPAVARGARLGVAQRDRTPAHHYHQVSRECEFEYHRKHLRHKSLRSRPTPTGANAGRPACLCAAEHARRAPRFARFAPGPYYLKEINF
ncbi:hypothetical protein EVAR_32267_1 [Eumeta japonica]|uniref:Uncharacterized protein n=1 Tax=Eumeta variegata TaxID=151549 RepID=A0A4C1X246_EUMVA|nr:hypothetical protein EVAR_32267_1 [Eumeta japonica]